MSNYDNSNKDNATNYNSSKAGHNKGVIKSDAGKSAVSGDKYQSDETRSQNSHVQQQIGKQPTSPVQTRNPMEQQATQTSTIDKRNDQHSIDNKYAEKKSDLYNDSKDACATTTNDKITTKE